MDEEAGCGDPTWGPRRITKSGSWFAFGDQRIGQGRMAAIAWLREHPAEREMLAQELRSGLASEPMQMAA